MQKTDRENKFREHNNYDEIDLSVVASYIGGLFKAIGNAISSIVQAVLNQIVVVGIIFLLGLGIAYSLFYFTKPYYKSTMTLVLANIRNEFVEDQLNKLTEMIDEDNYEAVASRLDIDIQSASKIKEMKFSNLDQDRIEEDSILTGSPFRIELSLYERDLFETMEPAITNYIENNKYFARQKRIKQREVQNMVSKLRDEITSIDSMKTSVSEPRGPVNGFIYGQPIDPTNLYRESVSMYKEQVKLETDLERLDNVEIVTGFAPRLRPTGPKLLHFLAAGAIISFILGSIVAIDLESKRRRRAGIA